MRSGGAGRRAGPGLVLATLSVLAGPGQAQGQEVDPEEVSDAARTKLCWASLSRPSLSASSPSPNQAQASRPSLSSAAFLRQASALDAASVVPLESFPRCSAK